MNYEWLRKLYLDIAKAGRGTSTCIAGPYTLTISAAELATFPTIESACYTSAKSKQLHRNYWKPEFFKVMQEDLASSRAYGTMVLQNEPKRGKGQTTEFCLKRMEVARVNNRLHVFIYYRTAEAYRAFRADLWLFHSELSKLPWPVDRVTMSFDTIQCQRQTIYEVFRLDPKLGEAVVKDANEVNPAFGRALNQQIAKVLDPAVVLKRRKDIRARALFQKLQSN